MHKYKYEDKRSGTTVFGRTTRNIQPAAKEKVECRPESSSSSEEDCPHQDSSRCFQTSLSYAQELVQVPGSVPPRFQPGSVSVPGANTITGDFEICFNKDLSSAEWKLTINGATENNRVIAAHLHAGFANENGPVVVPIFENATGFPNNKLSFGGIINNSSITPMPLPPVPGYNSVASLYWGLLRGNIYVNVHSTLLPGGAARGQLFGDCQNVV